MMCIPSHLFQVAVAFVSILSLARSEPFFFKQNQAQGHYKRPVHYVKEEPVSYGSPSKAPPPVEVEDGYGAPAAPVLSSYDEPASYSSPVKVKKSVPAPVKQVNYEEEIDGYGSPVAPVLGASESQPSLPLYRPPAKYSRPVYKRPPRQSVYRKPKQMFQTILDYMPMMNLLLMAASRKPKRHIRPYQALSPQNNRHIRMPLKLRMPNYLRLPTPFKYTSPAVQSHKSPKLVQTYTKPSKYNPIKLEYSGWQPIELNQYSPQPPKREIKEEPEIITLDNAHRHPKKYELPNLPIGSYAPEPITAKPFFNPESESEEEAPINAVYGGPISQSIKGVTVVNEDEGYTPAAPIEEPLFDSAPVQDLTSLAEVEEYEQPSQSSYGYRNSYQATYNSNHLAQEVQSGSVYVSKPEEKDPVEEEFDEDIYHIFYEPVKATSSPRKRLPVTPAKSSPYNSASTASFNIHVNGRQHGFSHNTDHY